MMATINLSQILRQQESTVIAVLAEHGARKQLRHLRSWLQLLWTNLAKD